MSDRLGTFRGMVMVTAFRSPHTAEGPRKSACRRLSSLAQRVVLLLQMAAIGSLHGAQYAQAEVVLNEMLETEQVAATDSARFQFVPSSTVIAAVSAPRKNTLDVSRTMARAEAGAVVTAAADRVSIVAFGVIVLFGGMALIAALPSAAPVAVSPKPRRGGSQGSKGTSPGSSARNVEQECRARLAEVADCWRRAEAAVLHLDTHHPLRTLLEKELSSIGWRLSMYPRLEPAKAGALTNGYTLDYWRQLNREVSRALRELRRVSATAEAGRASVGTQTSLPQMPQSLDEAYFVLGVNADVNDDTLKRLVRALRQCWHPDLAQNTTERDYREARIRQINVANDLISKQWQASDQSAG